jgi:aminoglycoside N3'-acetyltransferase
VLFRKYYLCDRVKEGNLGGTHAIRMEIRNVYKILVQTLKGRLFGRNTHRWEDNIRMDLQRIRI